MSRYVAREKHRTVIKCTFFCQKTRSGEVIYGSRSVKYEMFLNTLGTLLHKRPSSINIDKQYVQLENITLP